MDKHYKVSFCTTCKGRLEHLKQTLPENIKNNQDYPNTEFVILDYDSGDGLQEWIKDNYQAELASGKIRYARYAPAPYFLPAHAKNMAHRLATGDILCNMNADNFMGKDKEGKGFACWLDEHFHHHPDSYIKPLSRAIQKILKAVTRFEPTEPGLSGRIAMLRRNFYQLNGYDEKFNGYGREDNNLAYRASHSRSLKHCLIPRDILGHTIEHTHEERIENIRPKGQKEFWDHRIMVNSTCMGLPVGRVMEIANYAKWILGYRLKANPNGKFGEIGEGAALYDINNDPIIIPPIPKANKGHGTLPATERY